jgi:mRNA interferase RelE/StbE
MQLSTSAELHADLRGCYKIKIKLRKHGYRLIYSVEEDALIVLILAVDKREDMLAYRSVIARLLAIR